MENHKPKAASFDTMLKFEDREYYIALNMRERLHQYIWDMIKHKPSTY